YLAGFDFFPQIIYLDRKFHVFTRTSPVHYPLSQYLLFHVIHINTKTTNTILSRNTICLALPQF
ncbi:MAG: hypothetical protein PVG39_23135, partial [Desulfobacteraceae bacterium]